MPNPVLQFPGIRVGPGALIKLRQYVDRRLVVLRTDRWSYWQHWRQLSDFILPRRGRYLMTPNQATRGDPRWERG